MTSSSAGEGKTTVATNLAIAFARSGGKVLQMDADLRSPSLHHVHELPNTLGLTNHLAGNTKPGDIAQPSQVVGLFVVTSGPLPPNPMELLASAKMFDFMSLSAERFDLVIIDGPPVIGLADAVVLSKLARSTIFVTTIGHTRHGTPRRGGKASPHRERQHHRCRRQPVRPRRRALWIRGSGNFWVVLNV